ncbi:unnamed protein product, partial [marine sediment metagenome]
MGSWDVGGWTADITVYADGTITDFPDGALIILWCDELYDGEADFRSVGGWYGQEDILLTAFIISDSVRMDYERGLVTFRVVTIQDLLKKLTIWGANLKSTTGDPTGWFGIEDMTAELAAWWVIENRTTLGNLVDLYFWGGTGAGKPLDFLDFTERDAYSIINDDILSCLCARFVCGRYNTMTGTRDYNLLTEAQRAMIGAPLMTIERDHWRDDLEVG